MMVLEENIKHGFNDGTFYLFILGACIGRLSTFPLYMDLNLNVRKVFFQHKLRQDTMDTTYDANMIFFCFRFLVFGLSD